MGIIIVPALLSGCENNGHNAVKSAVPSIICAVSISVSEMKLNLALFSDLGVWGNAL